MAVKTHNNISRVVVTKKILVQYELSGFWDALAEPPTKLFILSIEHSAFYQRSYVFKAHETTEGSNLNYWYRGMCFSMTLLSLLLIV